MPRIGVGGRGAFDVPADLRLVRAIEGQGWTFCTVRRLCKMHQLSGRILAGEPAE